MKCQKCGKYDATTHITEIINGLKNETYLCKYCSEEYNQSSSLHSIFKNNFDSFFDDFWKAPTAIGQPTTKVCPNCKSTMRDIQHNGRLGCSECYRTFRDFLKSSLKSIHQSTCYLGKNPIANTPQISQIDTLRQELSRAVEAENFEEAARLRDKIRGMEA